MMQIHPRQQNRDELMAELEAAGCQVRGPKILCGFHEDKNPSASVFQGKDGVWRYRCFSCEAKGDVFDMEARRTQRPLSEVLKKYRQDGPGTTNATPARAKEPPKRFATLQAIYDILERKHEGKLEALHEYRDGGGALVQYVIRWRAADGEKKIWPAVQTGEGLELRAPEKRCLYRLPEIAAAECVVVTEGERKADILAGYGFPATTSAGGSKAAAKTDWTPLAGKRIVIWPDHDEPGRGYAQDVRAILEALNPPATISLIDPTSLDLEPGEDAVDFVQQLKVARYNEIEIKRELAGAVGKAKSTGPAAELEARYGDIFTGRHRAMETGFALLDSVVQCLPKSLNLCCGSPGASKSLLMLQLAAGWIDQRTRVAIFELEKDKPFHLQRVLAQRAEESRLTNAKWAAENPEIVRQVLSDHRSFLDQVGRMMWTVPDKIITQADVIAWAKQRADSAFQVLVIDPVTIAERQGKAWEADAGFVQHLRRIADGSRAAIWLVCHPSKEVITRPDLALIGGGSSYSRFCDNAIWLEAHEEKNSRVLTCVGTDEAEHNRSLWLLKTRDGGGTGSRIAYNFDKADLKTREFGLIVRATSGHTARTAAE